MQVYQGIGVSEGVAIAKILKIHSAFVNYPRIELQDAGDVPLEVDRVKRAQSNRDAAQGSEHSI